jgi:hypothetical protein
VATNLTDMDGEAGAADGICRYCRIESRTELNGNKKAQDRFTELMDVYNEWKRNDTF